MTLIEVLLLIITLSTIASAGALVGIFLHLNGAVRLLEGLSRDTRESVRRIDKVGAELQSLLHRADRDYRLVSNAARLVLGEVVLPVRGAASLLRGVRTGVKVLFRPRRRLLNSTPSERSRP